jgi:hypothetical protein
MRSPLLSVALVVIVLVSSTLASSTLSISNSGIVAASAGQWFDYVVVIMLENHSINDTYYKGVGPNPCIGNCTYFISFANTYGFAEGYDTDSIASGSAGDYIAITSGIGNAPNSCNSGPKPPNTNGCPLFTELNIVDRLENAGRSWKAYMEGMPQSSGCVSIDNSATKYSVIHNPFVFYQTIRNNAQRCSNIVNANTVVNSQSNNGCWPSALENDNVLINDLGSVSTASNYMWLTPNSIDDLHDCVTNDVSIGNAWMNEMIPQILNSFIFRTQRAALFVTFDEPDCTFTSPSPCPPHAKQMYSVWASNQLNSNHPTLLMHKSASAYNHYSLLRTIEDNWKLQPLIATADGSAKNMTEFFR